MQGVTFPVVNAAGQETPDKKQELQTFAFRLKNPAHLDSLVEVIEKNKKGEEVSSPAPFLALECVEVLNSSEETLNPLKEGLLIGHPHGCRKLRRSEARDWGCCLRYAHSVWLWSLQACLSVCTSERRYYCMVKGHCLEW